MVETRRSAGEREAREKEEQERRKKAKIAAWKRRREAGLLSPVNKLQQRETEGSALPRRGSFLADHFRNLRIQATHEPIHAALHDCFGLDVDEDPGIWYIQRHGQLIFLIANSGLCCVYSRASNNRLGILNKSHNEKIIQLHFNDLDGSVLYTTSTAGVERCCQAYIALLSQGNFAESKYVFGTLRPPYVCCIQGRAIIYSVDSLQRRSFDIYDLSSYSHVFSISDPATVQRVERVPGSGLMLVWRKRAGGGAVLSIINVASGERLKKYVLPYNINAASVVKDRFVFGKIGSNFMRVLNLKTGSLRHVQSTLSSLSTSFRRLTLESELLLSVNRPDEKFYIWDVDENGECMLCRGKCLMYGKNVMPIHDNRYILSYYCSDGDQPVGTITVTHTRTNQVVAQISSDAQDNPATVQVLEDISTMYYDEDKYELITGTDGGAFQIWSSLSSPPPLG